jgi:hypothetical protein
MRLFIIATTDWVAFVWMIKAEYVAELMDGHPVADRLDEISRSSEACPAA